MPAGGIRIMSVRARVYRVPVAAGIASRFERVTDRRCVVVEVTDAEGAVGWGETWANFPNCGAEHRARLIDSYFASRVCEQPFSDPGDVQARLAPGVRLAALQSGEGGPFAQALAGIDQALWDLYARRCGKPLWQVLRGTAAASGPASVPVYASGIAPAEPAVVAAAYRARGYRAFKFKVGYGEARDRDNARDVRAAIGDDAALMVDANQGWDLATALRMMQVLEPCGLRWLEEPLAADHPAADWQQVAAAGGVPLAAGENLRGEAAFAAAMDCGAVKVIQPDIGKWGGVTGCLRVARAAVGAGLTYCPHWNAGGIGLLASAHVLAAAGGDGLLEVDTNVNPLRELLAGAFPSLTDGRAVLPSGSGIGVAPDLAALREFEVEA